MSKNSSLFGSLNEHVKEYISSINRSRNLKIFENKCRKDLPKDLKADEVKTSTNCMYFSHNGHFIKFQLLNPYFTDPIISEVIILSFLNTFFDNQEMIFPKFLNNYLIKYQDKYHPALESKRIDMKSLNSCLTHHYNKFENTILGFDIKTFFDNLENMLLKYIEIASRCQLCHGDLHFENIIINKRKNFMIIDFGRAHIPNDVLFSNNFKMFEKQYNKLFENFCETPVPFESIIHKYQNKSRMGYMCDIASIVVHLLFRYSTFFKNNLSVKPRNYFDEDEDQEDDITQVYDKMINDLDATRFLRIIDILNGVFSIDKNNLFNFIISINSIDAMKQNPFLAGWAWFALACYVYTYTYKVNKTSEDHLTNLVHYGNPILVFNLNKIKSSNNNNKKDKTLLLPNFVFDANVFEEINETMITLWTNNTKISNTKGGTIKNLKTNVKNNSSQHYKMSRIIKQNKDDNASTFDLMEKRYNTSKRDYNDAKVDITLPLFKILKDDKNKPYLKCGKDKIPLSKIGSRNYIWYDSDHIIFKNSDLIKQFKPNCL